MRVTFTIDIRGGAVSVSLISKQVKKKKKKTVNTLHICSVLHPPCYEVAMVTPRHQVRRSLENIAWLSYIRLIGCLAPTLPSAVSLLTSNLSPLMCDAAQAEQRRMLEFSQ